MKDQPKENLVDHVDAVARAAATSVVSQLGQLLGLPPGVTEVGMALLQSVVASPMQLRRDEWLAQLAAALEDLKRRVEALERHPQDPAFLDTVASATQIAMRNSSQAKRRVLLNAIINAGLPGAPDAVKQQLFVRLLDELTDLHVHVLDLLGDPQAWLTKRGHQLPAHRGATGMAFDPETSEARLEAVLALAFPLYAEQTRLLELVLSELDRRGLVEDLKPNRRGPVTLATFCAPGKTFASPLGHEFLQFIANPPGEVLPEPEPPSAG